MTVLLFPDQRAVFGVDFMHVRRFPATLGGYPVAQYVDAITKVQALDFDTVIPGHGDVGEKADLALFLDFLRALEAAVASGIAEGKTVEELHETVSIPGYEDWLLYDERRLTLISEAYELLTRP
jgi:glyoxylase-like metal-dependent hydrolase (beta-lactamase superfamily II)